MKIKIFEIFAICITLTVMAMIFAMVTITNSSSPSSEPGSSVLAPRSIFNTFDDLLDSIEWNESRGDENAVGDNNMAIGAYQIHKIYVRDVNRILKLTDESVVIGNVTYSSFSYYDRWDKIKSRAMVMVHLWYYEHKARMNDPFRFLDKMETMARIHNGGPDGWRNDPQWFVRNRGYTLEQAERKIANTKAYWLKVKDRLDLKVGTAISESKNILRN